MSDSTRVGNLIGPFLAGSKGPHQQALTHCGNLGIDTSTYPLLSGKDKEQFFEKQMNSLSPFWNIVLRYPLIADITPFKVGEQNCYATYLRGRLGQYTPIPYKSLTQEYMDSNNGFKRKVFLDCQQLLINAFGEAKDFLPKGTALQRGFFVSGLDGGMREGNTFGAEVSCESVDDLIKEVSRFYSKNGNGREVIELYQWTKSLFVHEMVHDARNIRCEGGDVETGVESEIATSAVAYLSTWKHNPIYVKDLERALLYEDISINIYDKAEAAALRVLYSELTALSVSGRFEKPDSYEVQSIQRCIESIPDSIRDNVIRKISLDIIKTSGSELLVLSEKVKKELKAEHDMSEQGVINLPHSLT